MFPPHVVFELSTGYSLFIHKHFALKNAKSNPPDPRIEVRGELGFAVNLVPKINHFCECFEALFPGLIFGGIEKPFDGFFQNLRFLETLAVTFKIENCEVARLAKLAWVVLYPYRGLMTFAFSKLEAHVIYERWLWFKWSPRDVFRSCCEQHCEIWVDWNVPDFHGNFNCFNNF